MPIGCRENCCVDCCRVGFLGDRSGGKGLRVLRGDFVKNVVVEEDEREAGCRNLNLTGIGGCIAGYSFDVEVTSKAPV